MNPRPFLATAALVAASSLIAACGGSDDSGSTVAPTASEAASEAATPASSDAAAAAQSAPVAAAADVDACTLLTTDEVAKLFPQPTSEPVESSQPGESLCRWEGVPESGSIVPPDLVLDVAAMPADFPVDQAEQALAVEAKEQGGQVLGDLGSGGAVKSSIDGVATVTWIQGPYLVSLDLSANGAETQHDAVVAAARAASGRLG
jgi:hypothetical protein